MHIVPYLNQRGVRFLDIDEAAEKRGKKIDGECEEIEPGKMKDGLTFNILGSN